MGYDELIVFNLQETNKYWHCQYGSIGTEIERIGH
jgi:hypothetical protein